MKTPLLTLCILGIFIFTACSNNQSAENQVLKPTSSALPQPGFPGNSKPEIFLYITKVDALLLREQATKNSRILSKFKEAELISGTGEVSSNREEVTLRDVLYHEPYFKITDKQQGWVYGGGLLCVYSGSRAGAPDPGKVSQLAGFLKSLNTKDINSGKRAWEYVLTNFNEAQGANADAAFILLEYFMRRMEFEGDHFTMTENFVWKDEDFKAVYEDRFDMNKYPVTKQLKENGFRLESAEGMMFPVVDWQKLNDFFGPKTGDAFNMFIAQRNDEQIHQEDEDGAIILPLETVADRAAFWEKFNQQYPYFPLSDETKSSEEYGRFTLITGSDNTPVFDFEKNTIQPEFVKMWQYVLDKYPGTKVAALVQEMKTLCAAEGNKKTEKVDDFISKTLGMTDPDVNM